MIVEDLKIGDEIRILDWPVESAADELAGSGSMIVVATIHSLRKTVKKGRPSIVYDLLCEDGEIRSSRLVRRKWELVRRAKRPRSMPSSSSSPSSINYKFILAPMVGASELPFRLLCRKYGATLAYTPMMHSDSFVRSEDYRTREFQTSPEDRPLVAHFAANVLYIECALNLMLL